jgi:hypothetical protein
MTETPTEANPSVIRAQAVKEAHGPELLRKANVVGVWSAQARRTMSRN